MNTQRKYYKMENKENSKTEKTINVLSIIAMILGLLLSIILSYKLIFVTQGKVGDEEIKLIFILFSAGLLGTTLSFVLKKFIRDYVTKYMDNEKLNEFIRISIEEVRTREREEDDEAKSIESADTIDPNYDTVIVPVASSINEIMRNTYYRCPKDRKFKSGITNIAFYMNKEIIGWGKVKGDSKIDENDKAYQIYYFENINDLSIPHERKGAFVQNKMYCNLNNLKKAKNTDEIKN